MGNDKNLHSRILKALNKIWTPYFLKWPKQGCAAEQGVVFVLSVLNRVYSIERVRLKQYI